MCAQSWHAGHSGFRTTFRLAPKTRLRYDAATPDFHPRRKADEPRDRKSTRLNSSHMSISYAVFCLKKKKKKKKEKHVQKRKKKNKKKNLNHKKRSQMR